MCRVQSSRLATVEALSQVMRVPEVEIPDLRALVAHHDRRQAGHLWRLWRGRLNPWIGFAPLNGLPQKSAHMPRSLAPISVHRTEKKPGLHRLPAGGNWIRTCMGLFLSSSSFW